jgi:hypothetical protein
LKDNSNGDVDFSGGISHEQPATGNRPYGAKWATK